MHAFDRLTDSHGLTDGRTDRILIARPRVHSMQRGENGVFFWPTRYLYLFKVNPAARLFSTYAKERPLQCDFLHQELLNTYACKLTLINRTRTL